MITAIDMVCFACGAKIRKPHEVLVENETTVVHVGTECYRKIRAAQLRSNKDPSFHGLWQPPKGGPRLGCIGSLG